MTSLRDPPVDDGRLDEAKASQNAETLLESEFAAGGGEEAGLGPSGGRLHIGDVLAGRYRILGQLGRGAMGAVYEVEDRILSTHVALKTIIPELALDGNAVERFKREILLARKISHPNVCRIHDLGVHGPDPNHPELLFLTMELLRGETLEDYLKLHHRLAPGQALPILRQLAAGLAAAHSLGVVHRDFKSANVLLVRSSEEDRSPRAVITDFGLARSLDPGDSRAAATRAGAVLGTPHYMAPEQINGQAAGPAADVYAFGVVAFELLTGARPFAAGEPLLQIFRRRLFEDPPSPRSLRPDLDITWERFILGCLQREPEARWTNLLEALRPLETGEAISSSEAPSATDAAGRTGGFPASSTVITTNLATAGSYAKPLTGKRSRRLAWLIASSALMAALLLAAWPTLHRSWLATPQPDAAARARHALAVPPLANATGDPGREWLATALSETLASALAAGGSLRIEPPEDVALVARELGLARPYVRDGDLGRLESQLGADQSVLGAVSFVGGEATSLLRLEVQTNSPADGSLRTFEATGTATQLSDLVLRVVAPLRAEFGLPPLTAGQTVELRSIFPDRPEAAREYALGLAALRRADPLEASARFQQAVEIQPDHPLLWHGRAVALRDLGSLAEARVAADRALAQSQELPREEKAQIEALAAEAAENWSRAIEILEELHRSLPDDARIALHLIDVLISAGRTAEASATIDRVQALPALAGLGPRLDLAAARAAFRAGNLEEMLSRSRKVVARGRELSADLLVARGLWLEGSALSELGQLAESETSLSEAQRIFARENDRWGELRTVEALAIRAHLQGDLEGSRRLLEQVFEGYTQLGDRLSAAKAKSNLALVAADQGRAAEADRLTQEALDFFQAVGAKFEAANTFNQQGARHHLAGDLEGAEEGYRRGLALFGEVDDRAGVAMVLTNLGELLTQRGQVAEARRLHEEALASNRSRGDRSAAAYDLFRVGTVLVLTDDLRSADQRFEEARRIQEALGERLSAAATRAAQAESALLAGRPRAAVDLASEAEETARVEGDTALHARARSLRIRGLAASGRVAEAVADLSSAEPPALDDRAASAAFALAEVEVALVGAAPSAALLERVVRVENLARSDGDKITALEAALARSRLELDGGSAAAGRQRLEAIAAEAAPLGLRGIERRAREALSGSRRSTG